MKNERNWTKQINKLLTLVLITIGLFVSLSITLQAQVSSVPTSQDSVTRADDEALRAACAEAVQELKAARKLLAAQGIEIEKQKELLKLEEEIIAKLKNINALSEAEKAEMRNALLARDRQISSLELANAVLKKRKISFWKVVKISIVAGAAGLVVGKVLK
jgi:formate dehydrogenase maturation protein FdhE